VLPDPVAAATWCEAFQETVARCPGQVALRSSDGAVSITWAQYAGRVRQIAAGLASLGVGRGDTVALMMTNRPEFHLADTAAFHLGAAAFSVYNTFAPEQIRHVLANAGSRVVVCERQFAARLREVADGTAVEYVVCVDGKPDGALTLAELQARGDRGFGFEAAWRAVPPDAVLTLIYTSGTTGPPKGVELTHAQVLAGLRAFDAMWPAQPADRMVSYLPMAHIAERGFAHYRAVLTGIQVTTVADPRQLPAALREARPTIFAGMPRVWEKLKAAAETMLAAQQGPAAADEQALSRARAALGLDQIRAAFCGAAPIAPEILGFWHRLGIPVAEIWGMSECLVGTANPPGAIRLGTVGPPLRGSEVRLAGDGELLFRGPSLMRGYCHNPARTASAIDTGGWLHTGDLASIDPDGYVTITGRKKEIIITAGGKNISPANVENLLCQHPLIGQACVIGDRRPYITALLVLDAEMAPVWAGRQGIAAASVADLARHPAVLAEAQRAVDQANERLARVEQVKRFAVLPVEWTAESGELTPTLKMRRRVIAERYAAEIESLYQPGPG